MVVASRVAGSPAEFSLYLIGRKEAKGPASFSCPEAIPGGLEPGHTTAGHYSEQNEVQ